MASLSPPIGSAQPGDISERVMSRRPRRPAGAGRARTWGVMAVALMAAVALVALLAFQAGPVLAKDSASAPGSVWVTRVTGAVDPPLAGYLQKTMRAASGAGAGLLVVEIDTPGGLDSSMREIIQAEIASPVPVVFYVWPQGARSASAGVYIMMGADVAAMAPQTNLGSAHPVSSWGAWTRR